MTEIHVDEFMNSLSKRNSLDYLELSSHWEFFFFSFLFMDTLTAYGSSWARVWIRTAAAGLCSTGSDHICDLSWILSPLSEARDQTCVFIETMFGSLTSWATVGTPPLRILDLPYIPSLWPLPDWNKTKQRKQNVFLCTQLLFLTGGIIVIVEVIVGK